MIQGQKELERKFAALEEVCDQQMEQLVGQQAKRIQAEAKLLCPVRQGELRNSIKSMTERMDDRVIGLCIPTKHTLCTLRWEQDRRELPIMPGYPL